MTDDELKAIEAEVATHTGEHEADCPCNRYRALVKALRETRAENEELQLNAVAAGLRIASITAALNDCLPQLAGSVSAVLAADVARWALNATDEELAARAAEHLDALQAAQDQAAQDRLDRIRREDDETAMLGNEEPP